jgi:transcriptional regulator with XRE-family HTH domain
MNMEATGAYLRVLRTRQHLSQGKLAELVGVTGNTIWRIEAGDQEPKAAQLAALLTTLHGRIEDIQKLISDKAATIRDAERLADEALSARERASLLALVDTDEKRRSLLLRIAQLTDDPILAARLEGYLDALESGLDTPPDR